MLSDNELAHVHLTQEERAEVLEEINTEISVYFGMIYHLVEVFKGYDDFAEELSKPCPTLLSFDSSRALTLDPSAPPPLVIVPYFLTPKFIWIELTQF